MALYRLRGATDNDYPYVYTNPDKDTIITHRDRAFVLGVDITDDLQGDRFEMVEKDQEVELTSSTDHTEKGSKARDFVRSQNNTISGTNTISQRSASRGPGSANEKFEDSITASNR